MSFLIQGLWSQVLSITTKTNIGLYVIDINSLALIQSIFEIFSLVSNQCNLGLIPILQVKCGYKTGKALSTLLINMKYVCHGALIEHLV